MLMRRNIEIAERKFRRSAREGNPAAQFSLGATYYGSARNSDDFKEALRWIGKAAAQDYDRAQAHLGHMFMTGVGAPLDLTGSKFWYRKAAEQGHSMIQCEYAAMCHNGDFGVRYPAEAEVWWTVSASRGCTYAALALGHLYSQVLDCNATPDLVKAYMWYTVADLQDERVTSLKVARSRRDEIAANMTSEQIGESEKQVEVWLDQHPEAMDEAVPAAAEG